VTVPYQKAPLQGSDRLALLYRISQTFNSSLDLDQVLNLVIDEVIAATRAERGFLMLRDEDGKLTFRAARGLDQSQIDHPQAQVSQGVIDRVAQEGQPLLTSNAQSDEWLSERKSVMILGLRSVLCVPLQHKGVIQGVVYVDNRVQSGIFNLDDLELLNAIASNAAVAIENARLYQVAVEKGRLEHELQLALKVQMSLLPAETPHHEGWEFAGQWLPAREVSGDFYDFISRDANQLSLVIADVSDKGMPAALYMAVTRGLVRASTQQAPTLAEGIRLTNQLLCADSSTGMYVTLVYAQLDLLSGAISYVNAGHNPPFYYQAQSGTWEKLSRTGMALGVDEGAAYEQRSITLNPRDILFLYTDGVTEAINPESKEFGEQRMLAVLQEHTQDPAEEIVQALQATIAHFVGGGAPFDDITIVIVKRR
jgi:sigma-B regulation protein RsbU (phosphoserine phosphatase)